MDNKVKITANPKTGKVFTPNAEVSKKDGKQYGYIRLEQTTVDMSGAVAKVKTRSALKSISEEDFNKAKGHLVAGTQLSGRIRTIESLEKGQGFSAKTAGKDGVACTLNGAPIYQSTEFDPSGELADELIAHNNVIVGSTVAARTASLNG